MKDFPVFSTEYGVASLILKEVPYRKEAYVQIQSTLEPEMLLEECVSFCRMCGAEKIYASGSDILTQYPLHTSIFQMRGYIPDLGDAFPSLFPVTEKTVSSWRDCYNQKMRSVDNASTMEKKDEMRILQSGGAYFIHNEGKLLGIGWLADQRLEAIASVSPGAGELIIKAMQSLIPEKEIILDVASTNTKAIALYERMGFFKTMEISRWYCVYQQFA